MFVIIYYLMIKEPLNLKNNKNVVYLNFCSNKNLKSLETIIVKSHNIKM